MMLLRKYGVATTFTAPVRKAGSDDLAATGDWTPATGDVKVSKDDGAVANITTLPSVVTGTGSVLWKFTLSATEMQAARVVIQIVDSATKAVDDQVFLIDTYGNASAQHAIDLDDSVRAGLTALPNAAADAAGGLAISDAGGLDMDTLAANVAAILVDTGTTLDGKIDTIDANVDAVLVDTGTTIPATLSTIAGYIDTEVSTILTYCTSLVNRLGAWTGTGNNTVLGAFKALLSKAASAPSDIGGTFDPAADSVEALRDRGDAAWTTGSGSGLTPLASGTAQGGSSSTIQLAAGETFADDELNTNVVKITSGTGAGQARLITDYVGSTDTATVTPSWTTNPDATSVYEVVEGAMHVAEVSSAAVTSIQSGLATSAAQTTAQNDLDLLTGADGAVLATSQPNYAPAVAGDQMDLVDAPNATAVTAIQSGLATAAAVATVDGNVDAILVDTGTTLPATLSSITTDISNLNDLSTTDVAGAVWNAQTVNYGSAGSYGLLLETNLDVALSTVAGYIDTEVAAIKAVTDNLPDSGALTSLVADVSAILVDTGTTLPATLTTIEGKVDVVDGVVDAILLDTGTDGVVLSAATANQVADAILVRDVDQVEGSAPVHSLTGAILGGVSKVADNGAGGLVIYQTDGSTVFLTRAITTDAAADPISELGLGA